MRDYHCFDIGHSPVKGCDEAIANLVPAEAVTTTIDNSDRTDASRRQKDRAGAIADIQDLQHGQNCNALARFVDGLDGDV
jgi:hypothetical protein